MNMTKNIIFLLKIIGQNMKNMTKDIKNQKKCIYNKIKKKKLKEKK